tara:strand:- start:72 stop:590 length:519 start_codon:yes stop_codon:yes gene_type:complete
MMFKFANSSNYELDIVCVSDPALEDVDQKTKDKYLETTDLTLFAKNKGMTIFRIRALSHSDREQAEIRAGAFQRTELGRILNWQQPSDELDKAKWFDKLPDDEKEAYHLYNQYLQRVCEEMVKQSLVSIDGVEAGLDQINLIRPDSLRSQVFSELILHIRRISLLDLDQKKT